MALQKLCVAMIAKSFDAYFLVYCSTQNERLQRGFHLLRKIYSRDLLSCHHFIDNLEEKYADLLFNKYTTSIDVKHFSRFSTEKIVEIFSNIGDRLEKVVFDEDFRKSELWEGVIRHLSNVKVVVYQHACNNILKRIAEFCPRLESLKLTDSFNVTDEGVNYICQTQRRRKRNREGEGLDPELNVPCPLLKNIFLIQTTTTEKCIRRLLKSLPLLEVIGHHSLPWALHELHKYELGSPRATVKYNLIHLNLRDICKLAGRVYDDILKACVALCPNLKYFECDIEKSEHLNSCSMLTNIECLELNFFTQITISLNEFLKGNGQKLKALFVGNCTLSPSVLGHSCPHLEILVLDLVTLRYNQNDSFPVFNKLYSLTIVYDSYDPSNFNGILHILKSSPVLQRLSIIIYSLLLPEIKTEFLKYFKQCALKYIKFGFRIPDLDFLKDTLMTCTSLKILDLRKSSGLISDASLEVLKGISKTLRNEPQILTQAEND